MTNLSVVKELTKDGSNILDWEKRTTISIDMTTGQKIQVHFYRNSITGEVNYTHPDFKVKGNVEVFLDKPEQKIFSSPTGEARY